MFRKKIRPQSIAGSVIINCDFLFYGCRFYATANIFYFSDFTRNTCSQLFSESLHNQGSTINTPVANEYLKSTFGFNIDLFIEGFHMKWVWSHYLRHQFCLNTCQLFGFRFLHFSPNHFTGLQIPPNWNHQSQCMKLYLQIQMYQYNCNLIGFLLTLF